VYEKQKAALLSPGIENQANNQTYNLWNDMSFF
jgi:hypothetical protein